MHFYTGKNALLHGKKCSTPWLNLTGSVESTKSALGPAYRCSASKPSWGRGRAIEKRAYTVDGWNPPISAH